MSTTETTRPLPTTLEILRSAWLPPEPETSVSRAMYAFRRIDGFIGRCREELDRQAELDREALDELVTAAIADEDLEPHLARLEAGDGPVLARRLELLQSARMAASRRHEQAQRDDQDYVQWRQACNQITAEWHDVMTGDAHTRIDRLVDFAAKHGQTPR